METKMIRVPFKVELAKKITEKSVDGKIVTRDGRSARIICWDFSNIQNIVSAISQEDGVENLSSNFHDGACSLSSQCDEDLFIEIPEYMTFKDGDVATLGWHGEDGEYCEWITILKSVEADEFNILTEDYATVCLKCDAENYFPIGFDCTSDCAKWIRKPTEPEKQRLIKALKASKEQKAKEYLKRFFGIEVKQEYEFKPFDKVLVRCHDESQWCARFFDRMFKGNYACTDSLRYKQCIPYNEQTAHLLGTTEKYE